VEAKMAEIHENASMKNCIEMCWQCRASCQDTLEHILERGGDHINADVIRRLNDCIQICQTSADFMRRNSPLHFATCGACAEICEACAVVCEKMPAEHKTIQDCAKICHRCAQTCREMSQMKQAA
jgi:hypothetical protein